MERLQPEDLVLVAVMRQRKDLDIARVLGWYRIPLKSAPKMIRVDWIAFFLTRVFGKEKWSVRYLAPVRGYELVTRGELLSEEYDHPEVDEPYYKILLGPIQQLATPIPARRWRRFTFLYTTGAHVLSAHDVKDLTLKSAEERLIRA
jgi:hypothetical protein